MTRIAVNATTNKKSKKAKLFISGIATLIASLAIFGSNDNRQNYNANSGLHIDSKQLMSYAWDCSEDGKSEVDGSIIFIENSKYVKYNYAGNGIKYASYVDGEYKIEGTNIYLNDMNFATDLDRESPFIRDSDIETVRSGKSHIITIYNTRFVPTPVSIKTRIIYKFDQFTPGFMSGTAILQQAEHDKQINSATPHRFTVTCRGRILSQ